jgi:hypothetical protein
LPVERVRDEHPGADLPNGFALNEADVIQDNVIGTFLKQTRSLPGQLDQPATPVPAISCWAGDIDMRLAFWQDGVLKPKSLQTASDPDQHEVKP